MAPTPWQASINFVTRRTFDGVMVDGQYGIGNQYHQWDQTSPRALPGTAAALLSYNHAFHDAILGDDRGYVKTFRTRTATLPSRAIPAMSRWHCNLRIAIYRRDRSGQTQPSATTP